MFSGDGRTLPKAQQRKLSLRASYIAKGLSSATLTAVELRNSDHTNLSEQFPFYPTKFSLHNVSAEYMGNRKQMISSDSTLRFVTEMLNLPGMESAWCERIRRKKKRKG